MTISQVTAAISEYTPGYVPHGPLRVSALRDVSAVDHFCVAVVPLQHLSAREEGGIWEGWRRGERRGRWWRRRGQVEEGAG